MSVASPVVRLLVIAALVAVAGSIAIAWHGLAADDNDVLGIYAPFAVLLLATAGLLHVSRAYPAALHVLPLVAVSTVLTAGRIAFPDGVARWAACSAIVPAAGLVASGLTSDRRRRAILTRWSLALAPFVTFATTALEVVARRDADAGHPYVLTLVVGVLLAASSAVAARRSRPWLHGVAFAFALVALLAWRLRN